MQNTKARILIVDDERDSVGALQHFLTTKGYEVKGAYSGEDALRILESADSDLVLLDIMLPGLKGNDVSRIIKQEHPNTKIFIVTAYPQEAETLNRQHILDGVFIKPVLIQDLYKKLVEALNTIKLPDAHPRLQHINKARILSIKAKLLFIESDADDYSLLRTHFKEGAHPGKEYSLDIAGNSEQVKEKLQSFKPDILVVNAFFFEECENAILSEIAEVGPCERKTVIYNMHNLKSNQDALENLSQTIQKICLKQGLIDFKWVEI